MKNKTSYFKFLIGTITCGNWGSGLAAGKGSIL